MKIKDKNEPIEKYFNDRALLALKHNILDTAANYKHSISKKRYELSKQKNS